MPPLTLHVGVKSDPIECRYSFPWLFRLMAEEGVSRLQLGTFFEMYQLPDAFFRDLRREAAEYGIVISSVFTSHRELGGFFRPEVGMAGVAERNYRRLLEIGSLVGADSVGSNPGSVLRDRMDTKSAGIRAYLDAMKSLMQRGAALGLRRLTMEPMSCLAEPPTLPDEVAEMAGELHAYHMANPSTTTGIGVCVDVSHGYADRNRNVVFDNMHLIEAAVPYTTEVHLKNTDAVFGATFGFSERERGQGVVDLPVVRDCLLANAQRLPVSELTAYLEIGGPKVGRDYSDCLLDQALRSSLRHCREVFEGEDGARTARVQASTGVAGRPVVAPSMMCVDLRNLEREVARLEQAGADWLHFDIMDAAFTPNMPVGLGLIEAVRAITNLPFDVHLMVLDNDLFVDKLARLGVQYVSVHVESARHLDRTLSAIQGHGMKAGAALNPATPLSVLTHVVDRLDFVLLMSVNPGFAAQALVPSSLGKVAECRRWLDARSARIPIEIDGNVSFSNVPKMVAAGADILVCGTSSLFAAGADLGQNADRLAQAISAGMRARL